ncbi:MAG: RDD family protein [Saprospiraceae bacterium]|nr:RDD family protein [Saprospiraceae bacterium]
MAIPQYANLFNRLFACLIDTLICFACSFLCFQLVLPKLETSEHPFSPQIFESSPYLFFGASPMELIFALAIYVAYHAALESTLLRGTLGKVICAIQVHNTNYGHLRWHWAILRAHLKFIFCFMLVYILDVENYKEQTFMYSFCALGGIFTILAFLFNKESQTLYDIFARSIVTEKVVHEEKKIYYPDLLDEVD